MDIPARCVVCGLEGTTPNLIGGDNAIGMTLQNVTIGNGCPRCGGDMKVIDGTYDFVGGLLTAFRRLDAQQLRDIKSMLREGRAGSEDAQSATEQVAAISPELAAVIAAMRNQRHWTSPAIVTTLLAILAILIPILSKGDALTDSDHEALQHDIRDAIEHVHLVPRQQPGTTTVAPSAPPTSTRAATPKRKHRPPKTYGRNKHKKRR